MKITSGLFILSLFLHSCVGQNTPASDKSSNSDTITFLKGDSVKKIAVDDYLVWNAMLESSNDGRKIVAGEAVSYDKAWFVNDTLNEVLVFELYTDHHRLAIFHFSLSDIPKALMNRVQLNTSNGNIATPQKVQSAFKTFTGSAKKLSSAAFTSVKGFRLGDDKQKALEIYGNPDSASTEDGVEICEWQFTGDILYDGKTDLKGKPLAQNSYGHSVAMFFRKNKLVGQILLNDIP